MFQATVAIMVAFKLSVNLSKDEENIMKSCLTNSLQIDIEDINLQALVTEFRQHVGVWLKVAGITNNNQLGNQNMLSL